MIYDLENTRSMNIYNVFAPGSFSRYGDVFSQYQENTPTKLDTLYDIIETLTGVNNSHFTSLIAFVKNIANTYIFDFYTLDDVLYDDTATYGTEPYLVTIDLTHSNQLHPPVGQVIDIDVTLVLQPITDKVANNTWKITALSKICEYAFFGGNDSVHRGLGGGHGAIDIGANRGSYVIATRGGTVVKPTASDRIDYPDSAIRPDAEGKYNCRGLTANYVKIDHGDGTMSGYAHLLANTITVRAGDTVKQGQILGKVGSSGCSTGPHLHFEVYLNGSRVDPLNYVSVSNTRP
jgi:hypothetical protein